MFTDAPFALLITWTTFGTWLPGDQRGYVSNTRRAGRPWEPKQNMPGTPYTRDDCLTRETARVMLKQRPVWLTQPQALVAAEALVEAARKRSWRIMRAALMANHVHVVICDCPNNGPSVRRILKGTSQAKLSESAGQSRRWWTDRGSDRYLNFDAAILGAIRYVAEQEHKLAEIIDMQVVVCE